MSVMTLNPRFVLGSLDLTQAPFAVEFGTDSGAAANIVQVIDTLLADGQIERVSGAENRTLTIPVLIEDSDMSALAAAEAAVAVECNKDFNEFTIEPGDGYGAPTVFQVFRGQFDFQRDDDGERNGMRRYKLTLRALPFGFSQAYVVDVASTPAPPVPSTVTMSSGTSATGWTSPDGTVTSDGTNILVPNAGPTQVNVDPTTGMSYYFYLNSATYSFSTGDFSATQFISATITQKTGSEYYFSTVPYSVAAFVDGLQLELVSATYLGSNAYDLTWRCLDTSATALKIQYVYQAPTSNTAYGFKIKNVRRSNVGPAAAGSTGRQSMRLANVTGSARTPAAVRIEHETAGLGEAIFYTASVLGDGYVPALRPWLNQSSSGTTTTDAATVSGARTLAHAVYEIPTRSLPSGPYLLMARVSNADTDPRTVGVVASTLVGATTVASDTLPTVPVAASSAFTIISLGVVTLPGVKVANGTGICRIDVTTGTNCNIDEVWAFQIGEGSDLTHVLCGTGTPAVGTSHNRLFIDSPTVASGGAPNLFVGTQSDRMDAFHPPFPAVKSWGGHQFVPPMMAMFVVTTGAANPTVSLRHRPAWLNHAGQ